MSEDQHTPGAAGEDDSTGAARRAELAKRDAETQMALGLFVAVISVPVIIGTLWADGFAAAVNLVAGAILFCFGAGMGIFGYMKRPGS